MPIISIPKLPIFLFYISYVYQILKLSSVNDFNKQVVNTLLLYFLCLANFRTSLAIFQLTNFRTSLPIFLLGTPHILYFNHVYIIIN